LDRRDIGDTKVVVAQTPYFVVLRFRFVLNLKTQCREAILLVVCFGISLVSEVNVRWEPGDG